MKPRANHFKRHFFLGASFFAMVFLFFSHNANAATITWDGSSSTDWATAANWVGDAVPTSTDDVVINGSYTNAPTLNLSAGAVTVNSLSVGSSATSVMTVSNGDIDTKKLIVTGDVTIGASGTLTHTANSSAETHRLSLQVGGNMTVALGGTIGLTGKGYAGRTGQTNGYGPGAGLGGSTTPPSGGGYGGNGGNGTSGYTGGPTYGSLTQPVNIGSSGGASNTTPTSGSGGGAVKITVAGTVTISGSIVANGTNGLNNSYAAGGSGGSVWISAGTFTGAGSIVTNGGNGNNTTTPGGGGGGRIAIEYSASTFSGTINAFGGSGGQYGGAGTIYMKQGSNNGDLLVDNNSVSGANTSQVASTSYSFDNIVITKAAKYLVSSGSTTTAVSGLTTNGVAASLTTNSGGTMNLPEGMSSLEYLSINNNGTLNVYQSSFTISNLNFYQNGTIIGVSDLIVDSSATLEFQNLTSSNSFNLNNLTIKNGGAVNHKTNSSTEAYTLNLDISGNLDIQLGGIINLNSRGYAGVTNGAGQGPGAGLGGGTSTYGGGGSYGGKGGNATGGYASGSIYGSDMSPTQIGSSAGGGSGGLGGAGGGAAKISVGGTLNVAGSISCNGGGCSINSRAGGGSGGEHIY